MFYNISFRLNKNKEMTPESHYQFVCNKLETAENDFSFFKKTQL